MPNPMRVFKNCFIHLELEIDECLALACERQDEQDDEQVEREAYSLRTEQLELLQLEGMLLFPLNPLHQQQEDGKADVQQAVAVDDGTA